MPSTGGRKKCAKSLKERTMSELLAIYIYGSLCLVSGFTLGALWANR